MKVPSVGCVVHFHSHPNGQPYAAIITEVRPTEVSLTVFPPDGERDIVGSDGATLCTINECLVFRCCQYSEDKRPGTWSWPEAAT